MAAAALPVGPARSVLVSPATRTAQIGDKRKYNSCLITLQQELDEKTGLFGPKLVGKAASCRQRAVSDSVR